MKITFSMLVEELKNYQLKVYKTKDVNFSSFRLLDDKIESDIIYLTDITDFIALADKNGGSFIVTDPFDILDDLNVTENFNLIRITEIIEQSSIINILNDIFLNYWTFENNLLKYLNYDKPITHILNYTKTAMNIELCISDSNGKVITSNSPAIDKKIKSYTFRKINKSIGSIALLDNKKSSKEYQLSMFYYLIDIIGPYLEDYFKNIIEANQKLANIIFDNMINKKSLTNDEYEKLSLLGWKKELDYTLILLENLPLLHQKELNALIEKSYINEALFIKFNKNHIILLNTHSADKNIFISELKHILKNDKNIKALISSNFSKLEELNSNYIILTKMMTHLERGIFDYSKDKINLLIESKLIKENFISNEIIKLKEYDKENDDDLLETLYVYLACERSYVKTSELLNLHRNTIVYRINKIEGIINLDLESIHERLHILLSSLIISNDLLKYR